MHTLRLFFIRTQNGVTFNSDSLTLKSMQLNYSLTEKTTTVLPVIILTALPNTKEKVMKRLAA